MAIGVSTTAIANRWLDLFGSASQTGYSSVYVKLHTGDPGAAGATAASANTTRVLLSWSAASGGSKSASGSPVAQWASWASGTETISHLSLWDASTAGNFLGSIALSASKVVNNTDTLNLTSLSLSISTLAA